MHLGLGDVSAEGATTHSEGANDEMSRASSRLKLTHAGVRYPAACGICRVHKVPAFIVVVDTEAELDCKGMRPAERVGRPS